MAEIDPTFALALARSKRVAYLALAVAALATGVAVYALVRTPATARSIELSIDGKPRVTLDADGLIFRDETGTERASLSIHDDRSALRLAPPTGGNMAVLSSSAAQNALTLDSSAHAEVSLLAAAHTAFVDIHADRSTSEMSVTSAPDLPSAALELDVPATDGALQRAAIGINNASGPSIGLWQQTASFWSTPSPPAHR
jgi:hypothetical protein